jgi:hypothetical protein
MNKLTTNEDSAVAQDPAADLDGFSLPLPELAVLGSAQTNQVAGGIAPPPPPDHQVCGMPGPFPWPFPLPS